MREKLGFLVRCCLKCIVTSDALLQVRVLLQCNNLGLLPMKNELQQMCSQGFQKQSLSNVQLSSHMCWKTQNFGSFSS